MAKKPTKQTPFEVWVDMRLKDAERADARAAEIVSAIQAVAIAIDRQTAVLKQIAPPALEKL